MIEPPRAASPEITELRAVRPLLSFPVPAPYRRASCTDLTNLRGLARIIRNAPCSRRCDCQDVIDVRQFARRGGAGHDAPAPRARGKMSRPAAAASLQGRGFTAPLSKWALRLPGACPAGACSGISARRCRQRATVLLSLPSASDRRETRAPSALAGYRRLAILCRVRTARRPRSPRSAQAVSGVALTASAGTPFTATTRARSDGTCLRSCMPGWARTICSRSAASAGLAWGGRRGTI